MSLVTDIQSEPWFNDVESLAQKYQIPDAVWITEAEAEGAAVATGPPTVESDGSLSYGLFQLNNRGVGAPYAPSTLLDPVENALIAFPVMAQDLQNQGATGTDFPTQIRALEKTDWPGAYSQADDTKRQSILAQVTSGLSGGTLGPPNAAGTNPAPPQPAPGSTNSNPTNQTWWGPIAENLFIGAVILGIIAGAFILLTSGGGNSSGGTKVMPIPV